MIEHCMEELERTFDERRYRAYVTDALMTLVNNVARSLGGSSFTARWVDGYKKQDPRTPEEIAQMIREDREGRANQLLVNAAMVAEPAKGDVR